MDWLTKHVSGGFFQINLFKHVRQVDKLVVIGLFQLDACHIIDVFHRVEDDLHLLLVCGSLGTELGYKLLRNAFNKVV